MAMSRHQLYRLIEFCIQLKNEKYPNQRSFAQNITKLSKDDPKFRLCSAKTVQRDIELLKNDFNAPIEYDSTLKGYYLRDINWEMNIPWLEIPELIDIAIAGKISDDILPIFLKGKVKSFRDQIMIANDAKAIGFSTIESFIINWGSQVNIDENIFKEIFSCWKNGNCARVRYHKSEAFTDSYYEIEPHVLNFNNDTWYVVGRKRPGLEERTFAMQRIKSVMPLDEKFIRDKSIVDRVKEHGPYYQPDIKEIMLLYCGHMKRYAIERYAPEDISENEDGTLKVVVRNIRSYDLENHILLGRGYVQVLNDKNVIKSIKKICDQILR